MSENKKVFAYILLNADFDGELQSDLASYYWGGIIEAFIDCEEQWVDPANIWPFGWGPRMKRVSVVQITVNHNPCDWISSLISDGVIHPIFVNEYDDGVITAFKKDEVNKNALVKYQNGNEYFERFLQMLRLLATSTYEDIIFIGGKGFSADFEIDSSEQQLLREVGIQISSRMPI